MAVKNLYVFFFFKLALQMINEAGNALYTESKHNFVRASQTDTNETETHDDCLPLPLSLLPHSHNIIKEVLQLSNL